MKLAAISSALALVVAASPAVAHDAHKEHAAAQPAAGNVKVKLSDAALVDQNGRPARLAADVLGHHIVVMDFVYTTCTTVCPVLSAVLGQVQAKLAGRLERDVRLVSITVDPVRDTPARLKAYGEKHGAGSGWVWLTGDTTTVNDVLKGFGAYAPDFTQHPPMVLVGDAKSGRWTRFLGFPSPEQILAQVEALTAVRGGQAPLARHAH
jgi:protein SCO1/2